jgi:outer membrane protein assembly factor BamE (lipoprotein component of BamABCDE complex)
MPTVKRQIMNSWFPIGLAILCLAGCGTHQQPIPATVADDMPSYETFVSANSFPYVAPSERRTHLTQNYSQLSIGLTKSEVANILGKPDYSQPSSTKTATPGYIGSSWTYFLEKPDAHLTNLKKDKTIEVFFDISGKTHWIVSNIEGLKEIGKPGTQGS